MGGKVFQAEDSEQRTRTLDAVLALAAELGASADQVAIAWAASHGAVPMIGPRYLTQLTSNLGTLALTLSSDQLARLDAISAPAGAAPRQTAAHIA